VTPDLPVLAFIARDELIQAREVSPVDAAVHRRDRIPAPDGGLASFALVRRKSAAQHHLIAPLVKPET